MQSRGWLHWNRPVACGGEGGGAGPFPAFCLAPQRCGFRPRMAPRGSGGPLLLNCHATGLHWNVDKSCLTVSRRSRDPRPLSCDRSANFSNILIFRWNVEIKLFDSQSTDAWPPTIVVWSFSYFKKKMSDLFEMSKNQSTVGRRSLDRLTTVAHLTVQRLFFFP